MKTVLITGAALRIGRAIAERLTAEGWRVAIHCRSSIAEARALAETLAGAVVVAGDLTDAAVPERLVAEAADRLGGLSALVNNASEFEADDLMTLTPESWSLHLDTNLRAPVFLTQAFARQLVPETQGNVINIIDQRVLKPTPLFFSYMLAKSALWQATRTMAQTLGPRIRVNAIAPGPVLANRRMDAESFARQQSLTPLGRGPAPAEIAAAAQFILTQSAMTGAMIVLDGGQHLSWRTPDVIEIME